MTTKPSVEAKRHNRAIPSPSLGRWSVVLAALLWSTSGIFVKNPAFADWPLDRRGLLLAFWRALFAGCLLLPAVRGARFRVRLIPLLVCFALMNVTYLSAMAQTTAANAIWLQSTAPLWVCVLGLIALKRPVHLPDLSLLFPAMIGIGLIIACEVQGQEIVGVGYGLLSGVFYGGVILAMQRVSNDNSVWIVALCHLFAAAVLAPLVLVTGIWPSRDQLILLAVFGLFQMGIPYVLFARGLRSVSGQEAAGIGLLEPMLVPAWVYLTWDEIPKWWTLAGGALILLGLAARYLRPPMIRNEPQNAQS